jgi:hypothetical protein
MQERRGEKMYERRRDVWEEKSREERRGDVREKRGEVKIR